LALDALHLPLTHSNRKVGILSSVAVAQLNAAMTLNETKSIKRR
jgi:hypothetical protein